ncbi:MAG TPA: Clp1/GlmU family protein [bacterium]|nr:Clp1/GlmU family protein [bacterium]
MAEWRETVGAVLDAPGTVMIVGSVDVGKTTAATALASAAVQAGQHTAVVDADTGQSDLGPPTTVGLGILSGPVRQMSAIPLLAAIFVGDTSPQHLYACLIDGSARLVALARDRGSQTIVVDTTGWVEGAAAVTVKVREISRITPRHLIAIQRGDEVEPILARISSTTVVHRLHPSRRIRQRSPEERRAFRERMFGQYFRRARRFSLDVAMLPADRPVWYAGEWIPQARMLVDIPSDALRHLLVGLADQAGFLVALGTVEDVFPTAHRIDVLAPLDSLAQVRTLQWGMLRVAPSGREEGRLAGAA